MKNNKIVILIISATYFILSGCTAMTSIRTTQPDVSLQIKDKSYSSTPVVDEFVVRTFGSVEFVAKKDGRELYGLLPLKFNGGYLALDILFFTPAMLFNLREVYPYYEIDFDKALIRYSKDNKYWYDQKIFEEETVLAQQYFLNNLRAKNN
jgi:hypothetical protein